MLVSLFFSVPLGNGIFKAKKAKKPPNKVLHLFLLRIGTINIGTSNSYFYADFKNINLP
jgi:hypothetical protein